MENKFTDFLIHYNGQFVEKVDPTNRNQCFDLAIAWTEWLGLPLSIFSGLMYAYQIYTSPTELTKTNFDFIANTPEGAPQVGDIVVWNKGYGGGIAGHVGMATGMFTDTNHFQSFEQNDPIGTNAHLRDYENYNYVLGWLRYKKTIITPTPPTDDCPTKLTMVTAERDKLNGVITGKDATINSLTQQIATFNSQIVTLQATISNQNKTLLNDQSTIAALTETAKLVPDLQQQVTDITESRKSYMDQAATLQTQIGTAKSKAIPKRPWSLKIYNFIMSLE